MQASGRLDIRRDLHLDVGLGFAHLHEARGSVDGDGGAEPVRFNRWTGQAALSAETGRFRHWIAASYLRGDFADTPAIGGGTLNQDDRDRTVWAGEARVSYEALPDTRVFVAGRYGIADFASVSDGDGLNRDAQKREAVVGIDLDRKSVV